MSEDAPREDTSENSWYGWGVNLLTNVKQKSEEVVNLYKNELAEFGNTLVRDTSELIQETNNPDGVASKIKTAVNESFETIAATINKLGEVGEGDTATESEGYEAWQKKFVLSEHEEEIAHLLANSADLRAMHSEAVPATMTDVDFWCRFFWNTSGRHEKRNVQMSIEKREGTKSNDEAVKEEEVQEVVPRMSHEEEALNDSEPTATVDHVVEGESIQKSTVNGNVDKAVTEEAEVAKETPTEAILGDDEWVDVTPKATNSAIEAKRSDEAAEGGGDDDDDWLKWS